MEFKIDDIVVVKGSSAEYLYEIIERDGTFVTLQTWQTYSTMLSAVQFSISSFDIRLVTDIEKVCNKSNPTPVEIAQARVAGLI